jgi:hypothetical protein
VGLTLRNPFGYSWSDDGTLTLEMWVYNGSQLPEDVSCDVTIASGGKRVAGARFTSIDGVIPPTSTHATKLVFRPDQVSQKSASLDNVSYDTSCNSHSA